MSSWALCFSPSLSFFKDVPHPQQSLTFNHYQDASYNLYLSFLMKKKTNKTQRNLEEETVAKSSLMTMSHKYVQNDLSEMDRYRRAPSPINNYRIISM